MYHLALHVVCKVSFKIRAYMNTWGGKYFYALGFCAAIIACCHSLSRYFGTRFTVLFPWHLWCESREHNDSECHLLVRSVLKLNESIVRQKNKNKIDDFFSFTFYFIYQKNKFYKNACNFILFILYLYPDWNTKVAFPYSLLVDGKLIRTKQMLLAK